MLRGVVMALVTTETDDEIRVISMREATRNEQKIFYSHT
jgi:uncharacterized DUF497 family protein